MAAKVASNAVRRVSVSPDRSTAEETCGSQTTLFSQQSLQSSLEGLDVLTSMALDSMDETLEFNESLMDVDDSTSMVSTYNNGGTTG